MVGGAMFPTIPLGVSIFMRILHLAVLADSGT